MNVANRVFRLEYLSTELFVMINTLRGGNRSFTKSDEIYSRITVQFPLEIIHHRLRTRHLIDLNNLNVKETIVSGCTRRAAVIICKWKVGESLCGAFEAPRARMYKNTDKEGGSGGREQ